MGIMSIAYPVQIEWTQNREECTIQENKRPLLTDRRPAQSRRLILLSFTTLTSLIFFQSEQDIALTDAFTALTDASLFNDF